MINCNIHLIYILYLHRKVLTFYIIYCKKSNIKAIIYNINKIIDQITPSFIKYNSSY